MGIPVYVGEKKYIDMDCYAATQPCPKCGRVSDFYVGRYIQKTHLMFVPIVIRTKARVLYCDSCKAGAELSRQEYKAALKAHDENIEAVPQRVRYINYSPSVTGTAWRFVALIPITVFAFMMTLSVLAFIFGSERSPDIPAVLAGLIFIFLVDHRAIWRIYHFRRVCKLNRISKNTERPEDL